MTICDFPCGFWGRLLLLPLHQSDKNTMEVLSVVLDTLTHLVESSSIPSWFLSFSSAVFGGIVLSSLRQYIQLFKVSECLVAVKGKNKKKKHTFVLILNVWFRHPQLITSQENPICLHLPIEHDVNLRCRRLRLQTAKPALIIIEGMQTGLWASSANTQMCSLHRCGRCCYVGRHRGRDPRCFPNHTGCHHSHSQGLDKQENTNHVIAALGKSERPI